MSALLLKTKSEFSRITKARTVHFLESEKRELDIILSGRAGAQDNIKLHSLHKPSNFYLKLHNGQTT